MSKNMEEFSMSDPENQTENDKLYYQKLEEFYAKSLGNNVDKLKNFAKYVPRQTLSGFLAKNELFSKIIGIHGNIIECGVFLGGGLFTWANLSAIYEPYNHIRKIVGFDTFTGFPSVSEKDLSGNLYYKKQGGLTTNAENDIRNGIKLYNTNRPIGHIERVQLVVGNAMETIPRYLERNQHLVVAMLYLDFDLYEPTKIALDTFLPRMPKGSILAFDELNQPQWPGETLGVLESVGIRNIKIERFSYVPQLSYAILE